MLVQFVKEDSEGDYKFRIEANDYEHLIISKKCFPVYQWNSGESGKFEIIHKTIVEIYPMKTDDLEIATKTKNNH